MSMNSGLSAAASEAPRQASSLSLALRQLMRDARAGELRLLLVAVALAVAALSAVGFFADRLQSGLARDARSLLGGDALISSDQPSPKALEDLARREGLATVHIASFPSMARATDARGGATRLVAVKAVSDGYPLRGRLRLRAAPDAPVRDAPGVPRQGTVWVDGALLSALQIGVGDELLVGDASLKVAQLIQIEPDRGAGFSAFSPRVMLHQDDLDATGLVQPASRISYRLAVASMAGDDAAVRRFVVAAEKVIEAQALRGVRVEALDAGRPEMKQTLDRAGKFLNLVALLSALLAAVAIAIGSREFASRHLDDAAMLRVLGASQRTIAWAYVIEFALVGLAASVLGLLLGYGVHLGFIALLKELLQADLPAPGWWPALFGAGVGATLMAGFGLPPVLQLARVPPLRVLRREIGNFDAVSWIVVLAGALGFALLLLAVARDPKLGGIAVGGFAVAVAVFALCSWLAVRTLARVVPRLPAPRWLQMATRQLASRPGFAVLQVSALSVGLLALILLVLLRTDLVSSWRAATPPDAPNRFVINIQPEQREPFRAALQAGGVKKFDWFPMIRGRLVSVNGKAVKPEDYTDERAKRLVEREFNLSHDAALPAHNTVVRGAWKAEEADALSVEDGLAQTLKLGLGDRLGFDIAGQVKEGRITSLRKVDWGSMRVNFFVMFPASAMPELPSTTITAFRAPAGDAQFDNHLSRDFPNITNIDVSASIAEVQRVLDQVIRAVEVLFGFALAAGLAVLFAAVTATRETRAREYAVMRALGAPRGLLASVQRSELLGVGALAGALASVAAMLVGWALARYVFEFAWSASAWVPLIGSAAGACLALMAGWWGLRQVLQRPVVETLRRAADV
jgi:putative ABC transport system permease protein